jgi:hypothetical protein
MILWKKKIRHLACISGFQNQPRLMRNEKGILLNSGAVPAAVSL